MADKDISTCRAPGCINPVLCKELCSKHYSRVRVNGSLDKVRVSQKPILKECECCGAKMLLSAANKNQQYCSKSCANRGRERRPLWTRICSHCHKEIQGKIDYRNPRKYCNRKCYQLSRSKISFEKKSLNLIAKNVREAKTRRPRIVVIEVRALRRIAVKIQYRSRLCASCGSSFIRRRAFLRYCSWQCENDVKENAQLRKSQYRRKYKKANPAKFRAQKSLRRAKIRGAGEVHSIDPIKVFERDKWRCHICGVSTPEIYRGTCKDNAPELEHIVSIADGGTHTWGNVACSCRRCNSAKGGASYGQLGFDLAV